VEENLLFQCQYLALLCTLLPAIEIATKLGKNLTEMFMVDGQRSTTPYSSTASKSLEYAKPKVAYNFSTH
jgi:hypothetical protein